MEPVLKYNRMKKLQKRVGRFWCPHCDMTRLRPGQKCKLCGYREKKVSKTLTIDF